MSEMAVGKVKPKKGCLKPPQQDSRCGIGGFGCVEIFDEDDFVAFFVVEQFVDQFFGHQDSEPTRTQTAFFPDRHVLKRILGRIGDC